MTTTELIAELSKYPENTPLFMVMPWCDHFGREYTDDRYVQSVYEQYGCVYMSAEKRP